MKLVGSNFQSGDTLTFTDPEGVSIASTASKLTFASSTEIDYQFNDGSDAGTWSVQVNSPDGTRHSSVNSFSVASASPPNMIDSLNAPALASEVTNIPQQYQNIGAYIGRNDVPFTITDAGEIIQSGRSIVSIFEKGQTFDDPSYFTIQQADADAATAILVALAVSQPLSAIYFAVDNSDSELSSTNISAIDSYFEEISADFNSLGWLITNVGPLVAENPYKIGVYAGGSVLSSVQNEGLSNIDYYWFDSHLGGSFSGAQITRDVNDTSITGATVSVDTDTTSVLDFGQWSTTSPVGTPCYCRGTLILTDCGEVPVEDLAIGDEVVTLSGNARPIKWIGRRSYSGCFALGQKHILPICFKVGSIGDHLPRRDLWISPHHAIYLEGVLIEAKDLINGVSVVQPERVVNNVEYFHIELETHDVIVAEGVPSESFIDDDSRSLFHNVHEYAALYPDAPRGEPRFCAPRRDSGYEVQAVRRLIARRAGLVTTNDERKVGLRGYVDIVTSRNISGWAQNPDHPEAPVCLDIIVGEQRIGQVLANLYREDLERAGLGSGRHGFLFTPPLDLTFTPQAVEVRRSLDGAVLGRRHVPPRPQLLSA